LRNVAIKYPFNYGAVPQTWESPNFVHPDTQAKGKFKIKPKLNQNQTNPNQTKIKPIQIKPNQTKPKPNQNQIKITKIMLIF